MTSTIAQGPRPLVLAGGIAAMLILWSLNYAAGKIALQHFDALTLASFRLVLAFLLMFPIYLAAPGVRRFSKRDLWMLLFLGFTGVAVNQGCYTIGLSLTTTGHSSVIVGSSPIIVLLLARLNRLEALTPLKVFGMMLSLGGIAILATEQGINVHSGVFAGDVITLAGAVGFALYTVYGKRVAAKYDAVSMNTFNLAAGALFLLPVALYKAPRVEWRAIGWQGWAGLFYMAAGSSVAAYLIFYWALRYMSASRLSAFSNLQPVLVILLGIALLGEKLTNNLLIGGPLTILGVYLTEMRLGESGLAQDEAATKQTESREFDRASVDRANV